MTPDRIQEIRQRLDEDIDDAAAQLLIALAFLVPRGTDLNAALGGQLAAYKKAVECRALATAEAQQHKACPCLHIEPCHPDCTCVKPHMSRGCARCCSYGSPEQQQAMAQQLATAEAEGRRQGIEQALAAIKAESLEDTPDNPGDLGYNHAIHDAYQAVRQLLPQTPHP